MQRVTSAMQWTELLTPARLRREPARASAVHGRTEFQRDFDRIVFSSAFRRLQGKTQVFPAPQNDIPHTRLTHSIEASCVGRSLGRAVAELLRGRVELDADAVSSIVAAASLAHDIGNPPFGHAGEEAIADFFRRMGGDGLAPGEYADLVRFESNALGFRMLAAQGPMSGIGDDSLTFATLAAFSKYPRVAAVGGDGETPGKHGVLWADRDVFAIVAERLGIPAAGEHVWQRHPLAFLTEAADDICYSILDLEDGYRLGLVSFDQVLAWLGRIVADGDASLAALDSIAEERDKVGLLRAKAVGSLVRQVSEAFVAEHDAILAGRLDAPLIRRIPSAGIVREILEASRQQIYMAPHVLQVEAAGHEVLGGLLEMFLAAARGEDGRSQRLRAMLPSTYLPAPSWYETCLNVATFVACMTDTYAIETFRVLKGMQLPTGA